MRAFVAMAFSSAGSGRPRSWANRIQHGQGSTVNTRIRLWVAIALVLGFVAAAVVRQRQDKSHGFKPAPSAGGLDAMQLEAAGRVALESAADAMERHDLSRLKMLSKWVRGRAQVVLFGPSDLSALDLAIGCLDRSVSRSQALASLGKLSKGKLLIPARTVCEEAEQ
jgi:hypothetical protein